MRISSSDREVILGTSVINTQMERVIAARPDKKINEVELREIFADLSNGRFCSALFSLTGKGMVARENGWVTLIAPPSSRGKISDKVWKAMLLQKNPFTLADIKELIPEVPIQTIRSLSYMWIKSGNLKVVEPRSNMSQSNILIVADRNHGIRPAAVKAKASPEVKESTAEKLWQALQTTEWASAKAMAEQFPEVNRRYLSLILSQWVKVGVAEAKETDGRSKAYRIIKGVSRPPVFRGGCK